MFRNKYKYSKNHGLLPAVAPRPYRSPITSLALLGHNEQRQYQVHQSPVNPNMFMLFNDKEYLHRECSLILPSSSNDPMRQMLRVTPLGDKSLAVYVTNDFKEFERNIVGRRDEQTSFLWAAYNDLYAKRREGSHIVLSVLGVEAENELTDLLTLDSPPEINDYLPEYLQENAEMKRRIRVGKHPNTGKPYAENAHLEEITSGHDFRKVLQRYDSIWGRLQAMKFMNYANWNWLQGELFMLSEIQYEDANQGIYQTIRCHYVLRVNQYLRSTASLMLKLGMNIRNMQQRYSNLVCDNNESKLFKILNECFQKQKDRDQFQVYLILEIGHYKTLKDQYQNLVPTSELTTKLKHPPEQIQNAAFLYLKHYHDHPSVASLLSQLNRGKEANDIQEYLQRSTEIAKRKSKSKVSVNNKSFAYDTVSSLQKKKYRNYLEDEDQNQPDAADLEAFIKKTAKLYGKDESECRPETTSGANRTAFKKSQNKVQNRMSLFEWGARARSTRAPKIYMSRNQKGRLTETDRRSAEYVGSRARHQKKYDHLTTIYGVAPRRQTDCQIRTYTSTKHEKTTKEIVDDIVQREILELGREDCFSKMTQGRG